MERKRTQFIEQVKHVHESDMAIIGLHHSIFLATILEVEGVKPLDKGFYSNDRNEGTAVIKASGRKKPQALQHAVGQRHEEGSAYLGYCQM